MSNSNIEYRKTKQIRMVKIQNLYLQDVLFEAFLIIWTFEFRYCFVLRILSFILFDATSLESGSTSFLGRLVQLEGGADGLEGLIGLLFVDDTTDADFTGSN